MPEHVVVPDVAEKPWLEGATVVLDAASLAGRVCRLRNAQLRQRHRAGAGPVPTLSQHHVLPLVGRIVDVLSHHGIRTGRLLVGMGFEPFPHPRTGWQLVDAGRDHPRGAPRRAANRDTRSNAASLRRSTEALGGRGIEVVGLPGGHSGAGERGVDEAVALAAAAASWDGQDVVVVSWDADVMVAPRLAGPGRIILASTVNSEARTRLRRWTQRRGARGEDLPPYVSLLPEALQGIVHAEDLRADRDPRLRTALSDLGVPAVPTVELARTDGGLRLRSRSRAGTTLLSPDLDAPHDRSWSDERAALLDPAEDHDGVAVVDAHHLLVAALRAGVPGQLPDAISVEAVLERLGLSRPERPCIQLAVVPDLVGADLHAVAVDADVTAGLEEDLVEPVVDVMHEGVEAHDRMSDGVLDSYHLDRRRGTVGTPAGFSGQELGHIRPDAVALLEKEASVLAAADLLWALRSTDGPVVLMSDRPDLVAALDLVRPHLPPDADPEGRVVRVGLHADPFTGDGLDVEGSGEVVPWATVLLTERLVVELLRMDPAGAARTPRPAGGAGAGPDDPEAPRGITDVVAFDAALGLPYLLDGDGRRVAATTLWHLLGVPADALRGGVPETALALHIHRDPARPLPRPLLARAGRDPDLWPATVRTGRVVGHGEGTVRIVLDGDGGPPLEVMAPADGLVPPTGRAVTVVVADDDRTLCALEVSDLGGLGDDAGLPHPATFASDDRGELRLAPHDEPHRRLALQRLLGPFPAPEVGDEVLAVALDAGLMRVVSTPGWRPGPA